MKKYTLRDILMDINSVKTRLSKLEEVAHAPYDFSDLVERLKALEDMLDKKPVEVFSPGSKTRGQAMTEEGFAKEVRRKTGLLATKKLEESVQRDPTSGAAVVTWSAGCEVLARVLFNIVGTGMTADMTLEGVCIEGREKGGDRPDGFLIRQVTNDSVRFFSTRVYGNPPAIDEDEELYECYLLKRGRHG